MYDIHPTDCYLAKEALPYLHPSPPLVQKLQQSVLSPPALWTIETERETSSVTVPSTAMGAKGTREAVRRQDDDIKTQR
jgi:hypothetical protein